MSRDDDNDEPLTDINVVIDSSALAEEINKATREHVITRPVPGPPDDFEPHTIAGGRRPGELLPDQDEVPTDELLLSRAPLEEDERTHVNAESLLRKAFVPMPSEPPLEETKPRQASSPMLPKSERVFSMDLPATVPVAFPASGRPAAEGPARVPRGQEATVRIVATPLGGMRVEPATTVASALAPVPPAPRNAPSPPMTPAPRNTPSPPMTPMTPAPRNAPMPTRAPAPTVQVRPSGGRRTRWGRLFVLVLLAAALGGVGFVKRDVVRSFVRTTIARFHR